LSFQPHLVQYAIALNKNSSFHAAEKSIKLACPGRAPRKQYFPEIVVSNCFDFVSKLRGLARKQDSR